MTKTPWTPGPWFAELGHGIGNTDWTGTVPIDSNSWGSLARVMVTMDGYISEEGVANARLIAQSPRMAEVLERVLEDANRTKRGLTNRITPDTRIEVARLLAEIRSNQ